MFEDDRQDALTTGTILHEYCIDKVLGSGAFGITYLARHQLFDTLHVIKEYLPDNALRAIDSTVRPKSLNEEQLFEWGLGAFLNEAKLLHQLKHPNIVSVTDLFKANGTAYFVMPYLKGMTFQQWAKVNPQPSQEELINIFVPLLEGLKYIHEKQLLHRDIKPDNLYITDSGQPVLIDFGAARLAIGEKSRALTQILTPAFAPIEQYSSKGTFTPALDVYSLGGCMYFAITGTLPEEAPNRLQSDGQPRLCDGKYARRYDQYFLEAIDKSLSLWAADRFQSGFEFQKSLLAYSGTPTKEESENPEGVAERHCSYKKDPVRLTSFLIKVLWTGFAVYVLSVFSAFVNINILSGYPSRADFEDYYFLQDIVNVIQSVTFIIAAIVFSMWLYRMNYNAHGFSEKPMRFTPGWSVGWYFVPIFNLFRPYQVMCELWKVSHNPRQSHATEGPSLLKEWWALWIISHFIYIFYIVLDGDLIAISWFSILEYSIELRLYYLLIQIVRRISDAQASLVGVPIRIGNL